VKVYWLCSSSDHRLCSSSDHRNHFLATGRCRTWWLVANRQQVTIPATDAKSSHSRLCVYMTNLCK